MGKDYYKLLGVSKDATRAEIKKAYKKLAKKYHPDLNKGNAEYEKKFKEINEAASVLGDSKKREQYDQFGSDGPQFQGGGGFSGFDFNGFSSFGGGDIFDNVFESFFGGSRRRTTVRRGSDLRLDLEISLEEAAFGTTKEVLVPRMETCNTCDGLGAKDPDSIKTCDHCHGSGTINQAQRTPFGIFQTTTTCNTCDGSGKIYQDLCDVCNGSGVIRNTAKLNVSIPAGVETGSRLRISGEGEAGERGGPTGDLYVIIYVKVHKIFERHGTDLHVEVPISFIQAVMGDEIEVPLLKGTVKIKIPKGTQSHTVFRLKNKGISHLRGYGKGDLRVTVVVQVPTRISKKQRELLEKYAKASGDDVSPQKSFFAKLKTAFE